MVFSSVCRLFRKITTPKKARTPRVYTIVSSDGQEFRISEKVVGMSDILTELAAAAAVCVDSEKKIQVPDVDGATLKYIVDFCNHHKNDAVYVPPRGYDPHTTRPSKDSWDMKFLQIPDDSFLALVNAASRLKIPRLIEACCHRICHNVTGKTTDELRKLFAIETDSAEDEQVKTDHIWYDCCPLPPHNSKPLQQY